MRIGIDLRALQAEPPGREEVGRYCRRWVEALLAAGQPHEYFLYADEGRLAPSLASPVPVAFNLIGPKLDLGITTPAHVLDRLCRANPDRLDVLVLLDPFERTEGFCSPSTSARGLRLAALVHDLSPLLWPYPPEDRAFLFQDHHFLEQLRRFDALLFPSAPTRRAGIGRLGLPEGRTATIGLGTSRTGSRPTEPASRRGIREELGIVPPFFVSSGGFDERHHPRELIKAFAKLPEATQGKLQLVVTHLHSPAEVARLLGYAETRGVAQSIIPLGPIDEVHLTELLQGCAAYLRLNRTGSGYDVLEAVENGAAAIVPTGGPPAEGFGDAAIVVDPSDPSTITQALAEVLHGPDRSIQGQSLAKLPIDAWEAVANRTISALERLGSLARPASPHRQRCQRPRVAIFSPFPPMKSGISDYAASLAEELAHDYAVELYHDPTYFPELPQQTDHLDCRDFRLFGRYAPLVSYRAVIYQMGNSHYHNFLYEMLERRPGIVTLHDFGLAGFHLQYQQARGLPREAFLQDLLDWYPDQAAAISAAWEGWQGRWDWDHVSQECVANGWYLNGSVLSRSRRVVVHSPWCVEQARTWRPRYAETMEVIPLGRNLSSITPERQAAIRERFHVPHDALVVASFGFLFPNKMNVEAIAAFETVATQDPSALFLLVGEDADLGLTRRQVAASGLTDRVRFLGRRTESDFQDLLAITDLGVNLRRPPTNGETSAALLDLLAAGVATIVTDVGTFSDYPDDVVRKVRWESEGLEGLRRAMAELAGDRKTRDTLGRHARSYVEERHEWSRVANRYRDLIEHSHTTQNNLFDETPHDLAVGA